MSVYHLTSIQISAADDVEARRNSVQPDDHWFEIQENGRTPMVQIIVTGANEAETDAIVAAINAPLKRLRAELADRVAKANAAANLRLMTEYPSKEEEI